MSDSYLKLSLPFPSLPPTLLSRLLFPKVNRCIFNLGRILTAQFHTQLLRVYGQDEYLRFNTKIFTKYTSTRGICQP